MNDNLNNPKNYDDLASLLKQKPQTIPIKNQNKSPFEEPSQEIRRYVLFTSKNPIFPNTSIRATVHVGNLNISHCDQEILYVLAKEGSKDDIYTVGIILNQDVNTQLEEGAKIEDKPYYDSISKFQKITITPKKKQYRVKITEIEMTGSGDFVKGYVLEDEAPTEEEKMINLKEHVMELARSCENIEELLGEHIFDVDFAYYEKYSIDFEELDELLFMIVNKVWNIRGIPRESFPEFFQTFLEQTSVVIRMFMLKNKLSELQGVAHMVCKSIRFAENSLQRQNDIAKAQMSIQYLESTYLWNKELKTQQQQVAGMNQLNPTAAKIKGYRENLHLIKDEASQEKIRKEIDRVAQMDKNASDYNKIISYLDEVFSIPWEKYSEERWDVDYTRKVLEEGLFGLEKVKERIVELVATNELRDLNEKNPKKGIVICLYGPPGIGKTSIAKHLAKSLNREMRLISFAGVTDLHFIKGHRRTYIDSSPGVFVRELIKAKTMNPVFVLDEIDKMGRHGQGADPYYSLMEILNHEENSNFTDHYLDIKVDFSRCIFVLTANQTLNMLEPLKNRLEIIEVPAYIDQEKLAISKDYLLPKVLEAHGLLPNSIQLDDETILKIIKGWCYYESGVRELKRSFEKIARKFAHDMVDSLTANNSENHILAADLSNTSENEKKYKEWKLPEDIKTPKSENLVNLGMDLRHSEALNAPETEDVTDLFNIQTIQAKPAISSKKTLMKIRSENRLKFLHDQKDIEEKLRNYLGLPIFDEVYERISRKSYIGVVNVLTVSGFSGHVMSVEVIYDITQPDKKNSFTITGNLKQVLQESLSIAKINAFKLLSKEKQEEALAKNYHIHFLQGSTPKDGPSAGLSVCTALLSRILDKPVPSSIAMTGELSLNGDVYKIGGLQSKLTAAKSLDIKTVLIPHGNKSEFLELPEALKDGLMVYFVKTYKDVYDVIFSEDQQAVDKIDYFVGTKSLSKSEEKQIELFTL